MAIEGFDGASGVIAPAFKQTAQDWTDAFAPELLVFAEELPAGVLLTGWGRWLAGVGAGLAALAYVGLANPTGRDRNAAMHMAAHWLTHPNAPGLFGALSVAGATPQAMASDLQALKTGVAAGDWNLVRSAFLHTPQDVTSYFQSLTAQVNALFQPAPAALPPTAPAGSVEDVTRAVQAVVGYGEVF